MAVANETILQTLDECILKLDFILENFQKESAPKHLKQHENFF